MSVWLFRASSAWMAREERERLSLLWSLEDETAVSSLVDVARLLARVLSFGAMVVGMRLVYSEKQAIWVN